MNGLGHAAHGLGPTERFLDLLPAPLGQDVAGMLGVRPSMAECRAFCATCGHRRWAIAEGYIPATGTGPEPEMTSHETVCILNAGETDAQVTLTLYFADRDPVAPYRLISMALASDSRGAQEDFIEELLGG